MMLLPARMLNEVVYCPRLFALEHVDGEWAESADTVRGSTVHRRVDKPTAAGLPAPDPNPGEDAPVISRSVTLSDEGVGAIAKVDLVETSGRVAVPVDYKKGRAPNVQDGAWPPERVQVCVQGLLLRAHGYTCDEGVLYFAGSRRRVPVVFTAELIAQTTDAIAEARRITESQELPPPLVDSPKCRGCSLVGICLPDETNVLSGRSDRVRPLVPARDDGVPLYVEARGAKVARRGGEIVVKVDGSVVERVRISDTSRVILTGAASVTTPLLHSLMQQDVPVALHAFSGRLVGTVQPSSGRNVLARIAQHGAAADPERSLQLARSLVRGKIRNQRVLLRRNGRDVPPRVLDVLRDYAEQARQAKDASQLLGLEGIAARTYFEHFHRMIKVEDAGAFAYLRRNRRPPRDPINALISFAYAMLLRECTHALVGVGLDAWVGFLHRPRPGKPALALDLMEEFRPVLADSAVINAVNNAVVSRDDFTEHRAGTTIRDAGRRRFIRTVERRMSEEITHPVFGTPMSYRRILEVQARLIAKVVRGELDAYVPFGVR